MARPLRLAYSGAWYHVMNRGLARNPIFLNDYHRGVFIELLLEIHDRYQTKIHAYCLMDNHYHILMRTPLGNISRIMRHLDGIYTQKFNISVKKDGPIFRGRFKSILVEADVYLLSLSKYIHLNPVKAKIVKNAEDYRWSSCKFYKSNNAPDWLYTKQTLSYFGEMQQRDKYIAYIKDAADAEIDNYFMKHRRVPILGTNEFIKNVKDKHLQEKHKINDIPEHKTLIKLGGCNISKLIKLVADYYKVNRESLYVSGRKKGNGSRAVAIYLSCLYGKYKNHQEIAAVFQTLIAKELQKHLGGSTRG